MSEADRVPGALVATVDDSAGGVRELRLEPPGPHLVGRGDGAAVHIGDRRVSREHAELAVRDGRWWFRDRSSSGSFAGGERVGTLVVDEPVTVRLADPGDGPRVRFGSGDKTPGHPIKIGRDPGNNVVLTELTVSRRHAEVRPANDGWWVLADLDSDNGTFLNGARVTRAPLSEGDRVTVGNTDFLFGDGTLARAVPPAVQLRASNLGYALDDGTRLLGGIDLELAPGVLTAVIGPSGAGKSTFAKVLTGALAPTEGMVEYDDFDLHRDFDALRTRIGFVPQDDIVHRKLTTREALTHAAGLRLPATVGPDEIASRVDAVLAQLGLTDRSATRVDRLSGGQRKRVSTALELLTEPSLLVLDEPTSGLDPDLDEQIMVSLRQIADAGHVVIVITHSPASLSLCDQVLLLAPGGRPAFRGTATDLLASYDTSDWAIVFRQVKDDPATAYSAYMTKSGGDVAGVRRRAHESKPSLGRTAAGPGPAARRQRVDMWRRQTRTLVVRHCKLIVADRGYAAFIGLLPLVLAVLAGIVPGDGGLGPPGEDAPSEPSQLLVVLIVGAAFMGAAASAREVIGERKILRRELSAGLLPQSYTTAKLLIFAGICGMQAVLLVLVTSLIKPMPPDGSVLFGAVEIVFAVALTAYASCLLALWLSAVVRSSEQVMPLLVVTVMAQLVLCGGLIPVTDRALLTMVSSIAPARWGYAAAASSADLREVVPNGPQDVLWTNGPGWWLLALGALAILAAGFGALVYRSLLRIDR